MIDVDTSILLAQLLAEDRQPHVSCSHASRSSKLSRVTLRRAMDPFPGPVRTLDALHLASLDYLREQRLDVTLATYDEGMARVAVAMSIPLEPILTERM